jgi:hypothetical protein
MKLNTAEIGSGRRVAEREGGGDVGELYGQRRGEVDVKRVGKVRMSRLTVLVLSKD